MYAIGDRRPQTEGDDWYVAPGARVVGSVRLREAHLAICRLGKGNDLGHGNL